MKKEELMKKKAMESYVKEEITFSEAAYRAGLTLIEMEKYLIENGVKSDYSIEDLEEEISEVLDKQIAYCDQKIKTETDDNVIQYFKDKKSELEQERQYKNDLARELTRLIDLIDQIDFPGSELGLLPDECLINVGHLDEDGEPDICKPKCKGECHDFLDGCQPDKCEGENPCPTNEIEDQVDEIGTLHPEIIQTCNEIFLFII